METRNRDQCGLSVMGDRVASWREASRSPITTLPSKTKTVWGLKFQQVSFAPVTQRLVKMQHR
ncbi:hypothetical protein [Tolypothrix sp. NIES-4075]|uniref:hypothetical protein n=1 Tax=Tolypothrix sp. NIES-4075 TaxID=2005459 RepID=UPI00135A0BCA|nr:hypothetical protein [Tolypothrix sp. NIES-4075]